MSTTEKTARRILWRLLPLAAAGVLALVGAGCGGRAGGTKSTSGKSGGTVTILDSAGSIDSLDSGYWYYQTDYEGDRDAHSALAVRLEAAEHGSDAGPRPGPTKGVERRQDPDDQDQVGHPVQPAAAEPDREVGGHQVRHGALLRRPCGQRLRVLLLPRHRRRTARSHYEGAGHQRDPNARRHHARAQPEEAGGRARRRQRARPALHSARAEELRRQVRRGEPVDLRPASGLHRAVHDPGRGLGHRAEVGLPAGQAARAGAQPELGRVDGLQAGLLRQRSSSRTAAT